MVEIRSPRQKRLDDARHSAIHEALVKGITNDGELTIIANKAELEFTNKLGRESEERFDEYIGKLDIVKNVFNPFGIEDMLLGIDRWIKFDDSLNLPILPVQIKSSNENVKTFIHGDPKKGIGANPAFITFGGFILVINTGESVDFDDFQYHLFKEVERVNRMLDRRQDFREKLINKDSNSFKIR